MRIPAELCHISSWLLNTTSLAKKEREVKGREREIFVAVYAGNTDLVGAASLSVQALKCCTTARSSQST